MKNSRKWKDQASTGIEKSRDMKKLSKTNPHQSSKYWLNFKKEETQRKEEENLGKERE